MDHMIPNIQIKSCIFRNCALFVNPQLVTAHHDPESKLSCIPQLSAENLNSYEPLAKSMVTSQMLFHQDHSWQHNFHQPLKVPLISGVVNVAGQHYSYLLEMSHYFVQMRK